MNAKGSVHGGSDPKQTYAPNTPHRCLHPKGFMKRFEQAADIDAALGVLLEASNEERKLRVRMRSASNLEEALTASLNFENLFEKSGEEYLKFPQLKDCELF